MIFQTPEDRKMVRLIVVLYKAKMGQPLDSEDAKLLHDEVLRLYVVASDLRLALDKLQNPK